MLSVELPDASGKTVTFYTYDGYLEENDRSKIHKETQKVNRTTVTGGAIFGLASFAVIVHTFSSLEECHFQPSVSEDSNYPSQDYSQVSSEESLAMNSSPSMPAPESPPSNAKSSYPPSICPFGRISDVL